MRQIDGMLLSREYLGAVHGRRWDAVQPAGEAETKTADICAAGRSKSRHTAQIAQNDGMKIARIAPGWVLFVLSCQRRQDGKNQNQR